MKRRNLTLIGVIALVPFALPTAPAAGVTPTCDGLTATIVGTDAPNTLEGTEGPDVVWLGGGNDHFAGKGGDDVICAGSGYDWIYPGAGNDKVWGEADRDRIYDGPGDDAIHGDGYDTLSYHYAGTAGVRVDARIGKTTGATGMDTFDGIAAFLGSPGPDTLIGSSSGQTIGQVAEGDVVYGFGGNDYIWGQGSATIDAGDGDDEIDWRRGPLKLRMGAGSDGIYATIPVAGGYWAGGAGVDMFWVSWNPGLEINLNEGYARSRKDQSLKWAIPGFESVIGTYGPDLVIGNGAPNTIQTGNGNDVIYGMNGDDEIFGNSGFDRAHGGGGDGDVCEAEVRDSCALYDGP